MGAEESNPGLIRSLYRALGACADHHSAAIVEALHIATPVDEFLRTRAPGRVTFVTGNPGEGKTHLLKKLSVALSDAKVSVCLDANERSNDELIASIKKALRSKTRGLAIAINEGILIELLRDAEGDGWAEAARDQLLRPLRYRGAGPTEEDDRVVVLDLDLRNSLSTTIVKAALECLLRVSAPCADCPGATGGCSLQANAARLSRGDLAARVGALLDAVAAVGTHATMRDLQGFLAFLLASGVGCEEEPERAVSPYWVSAFEGGDGALFDAVRRFDPAKATHPLLDDVLWRRAEAPESWAMPWPRRIDATAPLPDRLGAFRDVKRRALFEHRDGAQLLVSSDAVDNALTDLLEGGTVALLRVIRLLNRFFDRDEEGAEVLYLWMTHRYDAGAPRHAAAVLPVAREKLEILVPQLRPSLRDAFPGHRPDHVVLAAKEMAPGDGRPADRQVAPGGAPERRPGATVELPARGAGGSHHSVHRQARAPTRGPLGAGPPRGLAG